VNGSGSLTSWHFHLLAGEQVIGRQLNTGNRRYYHTDLLGSTRVVVEGATIVESYDFEPWGLLMPGRTLGSGTKEGFTDKERDVETGLDYFGARYYMPALARWGSVDPLAEKHLEWSPYNYVLNNPLGLIDPDGRQVEANERQQWQIQWNGQPRESGFAQWWGNVVESAANAFAEGMNVVRNIGDALFPPAAVMTNLVEGDKGEAALAAGTLLIPGGIGDDAGRLVIGKLDDLAMVGTLGSGERTLLPRMLDNLGSPRANWKRNSGLLRAEMARGMPIRDATTNPVTGALERNTGFLRAERNLLQSKGWTYDPTSRFWSPPRAVENP
jgi:RHS repeat-associated protein